MTSDSAYLIAWASLWTLLIAVSAFAYARGSMPERLGAGVIVTVAVVSVIGDVLLSERGLLIARLLTEGLAAVGFLLIAVRYTSLWLGGAMIFQAVQFSLQAYYFVTHRAHDATYVVINNIDFFGILACLTAGTLASSRRRRAFAAQAAE